MALLWLLFSLMFVLLLVWSKRELIFLGSSLAGPWAMPLLGNAQMVGKLKPEFIFLVFTELRERFNDTYRLWLGPQLWVFLHTAEETQQALHDPTLLKADTFQQLSPLIGNGLLISHGRYWATQRRLMTPAFQPQLLRSFAPAVAKHADRLLVRLQQTKGVAIEVTDHLFACLLDAIVDTSMGRQLNTQEQQHHSPIVSAFHRSGELLFKRMINPMLASDFVFKRTALWRELSAQLDVIHTLMEGVIEQRAKQLKQEEEEEEQEDEVQRKPRILLDALLSAPLSRQQIRDEVNTFVFAGVDTTTASMGFVLYALAKYPNVQRRLHVEVAKLPPGGAFNLDALNQLVYLDALIKEVLRHYTIVPSTGRQTTKTTTIGGRRYCAGVTLWINMYGLAHDASYFAAPYEFNPDRWLPDKQHKETPPPPPPYSYIPFSGGPHVCIGRKYSLLLMKLLTVRIVDSFHLQLADPLEEPVLMAQMVLRFRDGINIKFLSRNVEE